MLGVAKEGRKKLCNRDGSDFFFQNFKFISGRGLDSVVQSGSAIQSFLVVLIINQIFVVSPLVSVGKCNLNVVDGLVDGLVDGFMDGLVDGRVVSWTDPSTAEPHPSVCGRHCFPHPMHSC